MSEVDFFQKNTSDYICPTYARYPLAVKKAKGCKLYDFEDREYLDLLAGISVCNLGHSHPEIVESIKQQAEKLIHVSNLFYQEEQIQLARKLTATFPDSKAFFCNSGAEANEGAIKLTRRYMQKIKNQTRFEIITLTGSFHGRTMATLTATGQDKIKDGFAPLLPGFKIIRFNDEQHLEQSITKDTAAIMIEVIQGEGGVKPVTKSFVAKISELCQKHDLLLIVDEIQTGIARTGRFWAHEHYQLKPDIITTAKALAGGLPMGAVLARNNVASAFGPGTHGTTFGGSPISCMAALKTLEIIERDNIISMAAQKGLMLQAELENVKKRHPEKIREIRGQGLMVGIELTFPGNKIWLALLEKGFVLNLTQDTVLRLLPPLIIEEDHLKSFAVALDQLLGSKELCEP
ncbi:aspartate aminotransferase family protein [Desulfonatronovibrio magnus]|uniref:aspartate aminotransferase family protein n=1 Tax=Desulfonatronovibrio magnus TaxID=698827 RepID=UPI0005EBCD3A|nr:aspartate aminotransferase family protein [Desulfonatronovibrio magnus]